MRNLFVFAFLLLAANIGLLSCKKRVTPKKVEKFITLDKWEITSIVIAGEQHRDEFSQYEFSFNPNGTISVYDLLNYEGNWVFGETKRPTVLYFTFPAADPFNHLVGDWKVNFVADSTLEMTGNSDDSAILNFHKTGT